jgi:hypothetical protein
LVDPVVSMSRLTCSPPYDVLRMSRSRCQLENIYARLQVSSRTAAVTRAFPEERVVALAGPPQTTVHDG